MNGNRPAVLAAGLAGAVMLMLSAGLCHAGRIWWDGSTDEADGPPGRLLSGNARYWGEVVLTGMTARAGDAETPVLFDGSPRDGLALNAENALEVILDFQRHCTFAEIDLCITTKIGLAVTVAVRAGEDAEWRQVAEVADPAALPARLLRLELDAAVTGRFLRLVLRAQQAAALSEILVWGDAEVTAETPEIYEPVAPAAVLQGISFQTVPGVSKTASSDMSTFLWLRELGDVRAEPAVWSPVATWGPVTDKPVQPTAETVNRPVELLLARNETECAALALNSTDMAAARDVEVALSAFRDAGGRPAAGLTAKLGVFGVIPSRNYGNNIGPLLYADNMLGRSLMQKYLLNGAGIGAFPKITLAPAGAAILWLSVSTTAATAAGVYEAELEVRGGTPVPVRVEVADVVLPPGPFALVQPWNFPLSMFPFVYSDRLEREVDYQLTCGISSYYRPKPGSVDALARTLAGWYDRLVDVSAPCGLLLDREHYPQSYTHFTAPRWVNMFYHVSTHHAKSEQYPETTLYRKMAWDAFAMGGNGWGFWRYHGPAGNPWNDFDADRRGRLDYLMVYPGPSGPVATRQSEALREGWEDWRLLNLLKERRMQADLDGLLADYAAGSTPLETLRRRALRALVAGTAAAGAAMP